MQSQFSALGDLNQRLSSMRGIEFVVYLESPPDMWIICKQRRNSPEDGLCFLGGRLVDHSYSFGVLFHCEREHLSFVRYLFHYWFKNGIFSFDDLVDGSFLHRMLFDLRYRQFNLCMNKGIRRRS